jgi:sulfotransferase family protein
MGRSAMLLMCCGMYRSGSTLQYNIVRRLVEDHGMGAGQGWHGEVIDDDRLELFQDWARDEVFHVVKVHTLSPPEIESLASYAETSVRLFHTYRDLRDIAVSLQKKFDSDKNDVIGRLDESTDLLECLERELPDQLFSQKYEEMMTDLQGVISKHMDVLSIAANTEYLSELTQDLSLNTAEQDSGAKWHIKLLSKALPKNLFDPWKTWDRKTLLHTGHVSDHRGREGIWRSELSDELVEEIETRYRKWMLEKLYV